MKLVTQSEVTSARFGDAEMVKMFKKAGFDGIDYSMFGLTDDNHPLNNDGYYGYIKELRHIADESGITFEQSHAPFPTHRWKDNSYNATIMDKVKRSLEISGLLGVKVCVVHPAAAFKKNMRENNLEMYRSLEETAVESGVRIALENMWGRSWNKKKIVPNICSVPNDFNSYVDSLNPEVFTACLDLGHCGLVGEDCSDMIRKMGSRITALHVHDNDNVGDLHTLPYLVKMNWESILKALAEIDYQGNFTYEADNFLKNFPKELTQSGLNFMHDVGRYMINEIERYKESV